MSTAHLSWSQKLPPLFWASTYGDSGPSQAASLLQAPLTLRAASLVLWHCPLRTLFSLLTSTSSVENPVKGPELESDGLDRTCASRHLSAGTRAPRAGAQGSSEEGLSHTARPARGLTTVCSLPFTLSYFYCLYDLSASYVDAMNINSAYSLFLSEKS